MIKISGTTGIDMNGASITDASSIEGMLVVENGVSVANETQLSLKANTADLKEIGVGQTWQDVTASRVVGTTYTNTTGKPILVQVSIDITTTGLWRATVAGVIVSDVKANSSYQDYVNFSFIVSNGSTYSVTQLSGAYAAMIWIELR